MAFGWSKGGCPDGSGGVPVEALKSVLQDGGRVIAALDGDQAGTLMAWRVAEQLPGVERLMPKHGKDWNERLIQSKDSASTCPPMANNAEMNQLWQWHLTAKRLGKPDAYLRRITEVARDVVKGVELSYNRLVLATGSCPFVPPITVTMQQERFADRDAGR